MIKKSILIFVFFVAGFLGDLSNAVNASTDTYKEEQNYYKNLMKAQGFAYINYQHFLDDHMNQKEFNDAFGGAYFIEDTLYVNIDAEYYSYINIKLYGRDNLIFNKVNYSIKELKDMKNFVYNYFNNYEVSHIKINIVDNSLEIFSDTDEIISSRLTSVTNFNAFSYISNDDRMNGMKYMSREVINGDRYSIGNHLCTVGFAAKDSDGNDGFITAGHCVGGNGYDDGKNIYYNGSHIGDVDGWIYEDGSIVDAAFVDLRNPFFGGPWSPTKDLIFGGTYYSVIQDDSLYILNQVVAFHGTFTENINVVNTSVEYGVIVDIYESVTIDGITINDLLITNITAHRGDSGGPLTVTYMGYNGSQLYEFTKVIGILSSGNELYSSFTKSSNIFVELDITEYYPS